MYYINNIIIYLIQFMPKWFIKIIANNYIAGTNIQDAIKLIKKLKSQNLSATLDKLGEHTKEKNLATSITNQYIEILNNINLNKLDCNISVKPSHIGSDINIETLFNNFNKIQFIANKTNNFIRIDMEDSKLTDITLNLFNKLNLKNLNVGTVIQAYLYRSENDIKKLKPNINIRLCKGIYNENPKIAIKNPSQINDNYLKLLEVAFKKELYVGIATHDITLIDGALSLINKMNISKDNFEFQMLYGVPMQHTIKHLIKNQYKVRIYVPFGPLWYDYSIRRIKENPNISKYIIKNIFSKIKEAL